MNTTPLKSAALLAALILATPAAAEFCYTDEARLPLDPSILGEGTRINDRDPDELNYICSACFSHVTSLRADLQADFPPELMPLSFGPVAALTKQLGCQMAASDCTVAAVELGGVRGFYTEIEVSQVYRASYEVFSGTDFLALSILGDGADREAISALAQDAFARSIASLTAC